MKHKFFSSLIAILILIQPMMAYAKPSIITTTSQFSQSYAPDQLIVQFHPEVNLSVGSLKSNIASLDRSFALIKPQSVFRINAPGQTYILKLSNDTDVTAAVAVLNTDPAVVYAEPDYTAKYSGLPDDPFYDQQWGLDKIEAEIAWDHTSGSASVVIAIIDSGIDLEHQDLSPNLWVNPGEIPSNNLDDDNNGFIDDVHGWNFVSANSNVTDTSGHGSMVAGVAAARTDNSVGIAGVCGLCRIMPVKVAQDTGVINYSDIAAGIYYAVGKGANIINLSLGGYSDSITVHNAINYAMSKNILVVAGAGNDNTSSPFYPAAYEEVLAVAGTDLNDHKTANSNYGDWVDLTAPAENILSTTLGDYTSDSGTSYAAPFVAGASGLLLTLHPDWTPAMVIAQFEQTSDNLDSSNPDYPGQLGSGRLNLASAMQSPQPDLNFLGYLGNDIPDFQPEFDSTVNLKIELSNEWDDANDVIGSLSSNDPYVSVTSPTANFGNILAGEKAVNPTPFVFYISPEAGYSHTMPFSLDLTANDGAYFAHIEFSITTRSSEQLVSGTLLESATWTNDKIYKIVSDVGIPPDLTLTIEPGTRIQFAGNYSLNVGGALIARGTSVFPIWFEPYSSDVTWNHINYYDTSLDALTSDSGEYISGNVLQNVQIHGATGGIDCANATPYLDQVMTSSGGIYCALGDTPLWIIDSTITGAVTVTQVGSQQNHLLHVQVTGGPTTIPWAEVEDGIFLNLSIPGNGEVRNSQAESISVDGTALVENVTASGSISITSGQVRGSKITDGKIICSSPCSVISNNLDNPSDGSIQVGSGGNVALNRISGSKGKSIVAFSGNVENNLIAKSAGDGIVTGATNIRNNTLMGINGRAVYLTNYPISLEYNNFVYNTGPFEVYLSSTLTSPYEITAANNWWGTTDISIIRQRTWDYYDDFTLAKLIIEPLLPAPSQIAPAFVRGVTLDPPSPVGIEPVNFSVEFSRPMDVNFQPDVYLRPAIANTWSDLSPMPTARTFVGLTKTNSGKIYAIGGGNDDDAYLAVVEEYDPISDTWHTKAPMPTARISPSVVSANNGKIYALGGSNDYMAYTDIVEEYDPSLNIWTRKASIPTFRSSFSAVAANNGKIYAIGGSISGTAVSIVEELDPDLNVWALKTPRPTPASALGTVMHDGKIYTFDRFNTEVYDPLTDTWGRKSPMPVPVYCYREIASASNGRIYIIANELEVLEEYNPLTDRWIVYNMPELVSHSGFAVISSDDGKIYAVGGSDENGIEQSSLNVYTPPTWSEILINTNIVWQDNIHLGFSYLFSTLSPRGDYKVSVEYAVGSDGILIAPDNRGTFTYDYAGEISDTTPPPIPFVIAWGNGSLTQLTANAIVNDLDSDIVAYRYAIGTTPGGSEVINWTETTSAEITHSGLVLQPEQPYYFSFMARNTGGLWSSIGISNAVLNGATLKSVFMPAINR